MKQYFHKGVLKSSRVMLGRDDARTGWGMTFKKVVDKGVEAGAIQLLKKRNGKSILMTHVYLSNEAMEELVWLYENHPERDRIYEFELTKDDKNER